jgi:hypothetical protein
VVQGNQRNLGRVEGPIVDGVRREIHVCKLSLACAGEIQLVVCHL